MKRIFYLLIPVCFAALACLKDTLVPQSQVDPLTKPLDSLTRYVIKQGNHYCEQTNLQLIDTPSIIAHVTFDSSAIYKSLDPDNQADVNKLIGFSDCGTGHQQNSARLGWSWNGDELLLYAYAYVNSVRVIKTLGSIPLNKAVLCSVKATNNYYLFKAANYIDSIPRHCSGYQGTGYKLFPYFGGDEIAPHEIHIDILEEHFK